MKSLKKSIDEFLFKCDNCGRTREVVEFYDVPDKHKDAVKKMMDAIEPIQLSDDEIQEAVFIVFCEKCDEYSVMCLGGGGEWM